MGLWDDLGFGNLIQDAKEIQKDFSTIGSEFVTEFTAQVHDIEKTVTDTADELKIQAEDVRKTVTNTAIEIKDQAIDVRSSVTQTTIDQFSDQKNKAS